MPKYTAGMSQDGILPEGKYPFEVVSARLTTSKSSGAEMIVVTLDVGGNGNSVKVMDYLVFDGKPFTSGRIDQFRVAIGELILPGEEIDVKPGDLLHKTGTAHIIVEEREWNSKIRKSNKVGSYLEPEDSLPGLETPKAKTSKPKSQLL